jgi:hypothetical protein
MNERYIQALILGSIIGFAIVVDDYFAPKQNHKMMQKHVMIKDLKQPKWKENSGKNMDLHEIQDHKVMVFKPEDGKKKIQIKINSNDSELDIQSIVAEVTNAMKVYGEEKLADEDIKEIEIDLQNAKAEVSELFENVDIDIEVEVENLEL